MKKADDDCCRYCRWWDNDGRADLVGSCRRFPPTGRRVMLEPEVYVHEAPQTHEDQWCGEFDAHA